MVPWTRPSPQPNGISIGSAIFAKLTAEGHYTLQYAAPSPLKLPPSNSHGDVNLHLIHDSLGPSDPTTKQHLDFCRAFYCNRPTDKQTDRPSHSVCNNRPHLFT